MKICFVKSLLRVYCVALTVGGLCFSFDLVSAAAAAAEDRQTEPFEGTALERLLRGNAPPPGQETRSFEKWIWLKPAGSARPQKRLAKSETPAEPSAPKADPRALADEAAALISQAEQHGQKGQFSDALEWYLLAVKRAIEGSDQKLTASASTGSARMLHELGRDREALDAVNRSIAINQATKNARARSLDYVLVGRIQMGLSDYQEALKAFDEAQKLLPASESAEMPAVLERTATCLLRLNRQSDALTVLNRALGMVSKEGGESEAARINVIMGEIYVSRSDYAAAKAHFKKAEKLYRQVNRPNELGATLFRVAYCEQILGEVMIAQRAIADGEALVTDKAHIEANALPLVVRGLAAHDEGKAVQATKFLSTALSQYEKAGDQMMAARVRLALADVEEDCSRFEAALVLAGKALEEFRNLSAPGGEAAALHLIGEIYYRQGFVHKALDYARDALAGAKKIGDRNQQALSRVLLTEIHGGMGETEASAKVLKEAVEDAKAGLNRRARAAVRLAVARFRLSRDASERALQETLETLKELAEVNDRRGIADAEHLLGLIHELRAEREKAFEALQQALNGHRAMADRYGEGKDLTGLGVHYKNLGEYDKALEYFRQSLELRKGIGDRRGYAANLANMGNLLRHRSQIPESVQHLEEALGVYRELADRRGEADILTNLGNVEAARGSQAAALQKLTAALKIHREVHDTRGVVTDLISMGKLYLAKADVENAQKALEEADKVNKSIHNPRADVAILTELAMLNRARGHRDASLSLLKKALELATRLKDRRSVAAINLKTANVLEDAGDYPKALTLLSETLNDFRAQGDHHGELWALGGIAVIQVKTEDYENALTNLHEALKLRADLGLPAAQTRDLDFYLGEIYEGFRDFDRALEHYNRALTVSQTQAMDGGVGRINLRIGNIHYQLEDYAKAREFYEDALRLHSEARDLAMQMIELIRLGDILSKLGDAEGALKYQERALVLTREAGDQRNEARVLTRIGTLSQILGKPRQALAYYQEAVELREKLGDRRGVNENLLQIALVTSTLGDFDAAVADLKRAFEISQCSEDRGMLWKAYFIMGRTLEERKSLGEALESYRKAITILESMEADTVEESDEDDFIFGGKNALFETTLRVLMKLARKDPEGAYDNQALRIVEKLNAAAFEGTLSRINVEHFSDLPQELLVKEKSLRLMLRKLNARLADELSRLNADQQRIQKLLQERRVKEQAFAKLKERLSKEYPFYADLRYPRPISLHHLQKSVLKTDEAVLVYMVTRGRTYLFAIDNQRFHTFSLEYPSKDLQRDIEALLKPLRRSDIQANWDPSIAYRIYSQIFKPVEYFLIGKKTVVVVPHGPLAALPFEILVNSKSHAGKRFWSANDRPTYLLENYTFCYSPSVSVMAHLRSRKRDKQPGWSLVAFGDAVYTVGDKAQELNPGAARLLTAFTSTGRNVRGDELKALPASRREITEIVKIMRGPTQVYFGPQATETLFKKADLSRYGYIHLATHGVLLSGQGRFQQQPAIVFSLYGDRENDGFLQLGEVFGLKLNSELVVVSSCLSSGKADAGEAEGILALSRAFLFAGTDSVVLSTWQVNDESTARLFIEMYRNLRETSKAEALRNAKLVLLANPGTSHPSYWGPFILMGNWMTAFPPGINKTDPQQMRFHGISTWRKFFSM